LFQGGGGLRPIYRRPF